MDPLHARLVILQPHAQHVVELAEKFHEIDVRSLERVTPVALLPKPHGVFLGRDTIVSFGVFLILEHGDLGPAAKKPSPQEKT